ncbi:MAG TPA: xylose isomerase [Planctomycetaceae bacterium]|nr:xylose isomerase [Planctomycetaceae bacterium]
MTATQPRIGYCTNVHAGTDIATIQETLANHASQIAAQRRSSGISQSPLPVGLWIPASAAGELVEGDGAERFADWLATQDLQPLTINGFPFDNFHLPVVKHRVYRPAWWERSRLDYTVQLARLLDRIMTRMPVCDAGGEKSVGSISTLPLGWPGRLGLSNPDGSSTVSDQQNIALAGANLRELASSLQQLESRSGRRIVVAIEPEPGCLLDRCGDVVDFFERELPEVNHRRHLTVCHDVCHSAVMFESQGDAIAAYAKAGIAIGKVQISSAIDVPLATMDVDQRRAAIVDLMSFAEDRYLHQTGVIDSAGAFRLVEDLPQWLESITLRESAGQLGNDHHLRIHFHVPVFRRELGHLHSTQDAIAQCVAALSGPGAPEFTGHYEVETYAWTVLPERMTAGTLTQQSLAEGIAQELAWFERLIAEKNF